MIPVRRFRPRPAPDLREADPVDSGQPVELDQAVEPYDAPAINHRRLRWGAPRPDAPPRDLPAEPQARADMPPGAPLMLGVLTWRFGARRRPFVFLVVRCHRCGTPHLHPWRGDWPLSPDTVSFQTALCWRGTLQPYWVGLDPLELARSVEALRDAQEEFAAWKAEGARRAAAREAAGRPAEIPPGFVPLTAPPVGPSAEATGGRDARP